MQKPLTASLLLFGMAALSLGQAGYWTDAEKDQILKWWNEPGRYSVAPSSKYVVRLTTQGSKWLWDYNHLRGRGKTPPGQIPAPNSPEEAQWEKWIDARVARDRYLATCAAEVLNAKQERRAPKYPTEVVEPMPPSDTFVTKFGMPPAFAANVRPNSIAVKFDDMTLNYSDNVNMRPRYAYFRFDNGVNSEGTEIKQIPPDELTSILHDAGYDDSDSKVFKSVSILEGGFDAINTYDTGFISVGFIQFASLKEGGGSLGQAMLEYKQESPADFEQDFHRFGIDVTPEEKIVALDLETGTEKVGPDANTQVISDKRLIAAFQRAGMYRPFRLLQLRAAKTIYWPMNDKVVFTLGGQKVIRPLSDFVKSEAGKAVFLDRKVNTGNIGSVGPALQAIAEAANVTKPEDLAKYEGLLIRCLYYRFDPTRVPDLTKPEPCDMLATVLNRYGRS
ncbi:MAG: hypothetical protein GC165_08955 [Armatimonadetes bacterium]|nr:hypothetical protein [Armatimonadota bacterium]